MDDELRHELQAVAALLKRRTEVISDAELRENDPDSQLAQLQEVGEALFAAHDRLKGRIPGRLEHFMKQCSYDKALVFIEEELKGSVS